MRNAHARARARARVGIYLVMRLFLDLTLQPEGSYLRYSIHAKSDAATFRENSCARINMTNVRDSVNNLLRTNIRNFLSQSIIREQGTTYFAVAHLMLYVNCVRNVGVN